jgi:hypothetical protein
VTVTIASTYRGGTGSTRWVSQTTRPGLPVMTVIAYGDDKRWSRPNEWVAPNFLT